MSMFQNDRLLKALFKKPVDRSPIWLMRQAGRYLPEYRKLREKVPDFFSLCQTPELACEVTLQPIRRFAFDAAIIFSDILMIPFAMGCDIQLVENRGPVVLHPLQSKKMILDLPTHAIAEQWQCVMQAIQLTKQELNDELPLIGFAGSPWTVATYLVEGQSSKTFSIIKKMLFAEPDLLHILLQKLTDATVGYLNEQIQAGADVIMIFDTWGSVLSPQDYKLFSLHYIKMILNHLPSSIPTILFSPSGYISLECIADSGCHAVGLDWRMDLKNVKQHIGHRVTLQGNLDPAVLLATPKVIREKAQALLDIYRYETGYIFNLGHGVLPNTPIENVAALVETVIRQN